MKKSKDTGDETLTKDDDHSTSSSTDEVRPTTEPQHEQDSDSRGDDSSLAKPPNSSTAAHPHAHSTSAKRMGKSPGEIAFFKLLHAEFKKATKFFGRAQEEFAIREERVREGMEIMKQPNSIMVNEKWSLLAKSIFRLYKDLLLLETYAIMTYCAFSKILKKHDKMTGYDTRAAFMTNVVNAANFTNYPKVLEMISRCEGLYAEVADHLIREGKEGLYEDERLFINMIHRLNEQVLDTAESEGAERKETPKRPSVVQSVNIPHSSKHSQATTQLRSLVEENDLKKAAAQVSEGQPGCDGDESVDSSSDQKRPAAPSSSSPVDAKRQRTG